MESEQKGSNIAIVLSLFLIMKDQVQEFSWLGIKTVTIRLGDEEEKKELCVSGDVNKYTGVLELLSCSGKGKSTLLCC